MWFGIKVLNLLETKIQEEFKRTCRFFSTDLSETHEKDCGQGGKKLQKRPGVRGQQPSRERQEAEAQPRFLNSVIPKGQELSGAEGSQ